MRTMLGFFAALVFRGAVSSPLMEFARRLSRRNPRRRKVIASVGEAGDPPHAYTMDHDLMQSCGPYTGTRELTGTHFQTAIATEKAPSGMSALAAPECLTCRFKGRHGAISITTFGAVEVISSRVFSYRGHP